MFVLLILGLPPAKDTLSGILERYFLPK